MKKLFLLGAYFLLTPMFIFTLIFYQIFLLNQNSQTMAKNITNNQLKVEFAAIPENTQLTDVKITVRESRIETLKTFLARYKSPLLPYTEKIIDTADKYGLDYRLLPAIAMQESTLCLKSPKGSNNCWGFGIYGTKKTTFDDLAQAIEAVSKTLSEKYHAQGLIEPHEIMTKYAPSNTGIWAENVSYVMDRIATSL